MLEGSVMGTERGGGGRRGVERTEREGKGSGELD